MKEINIALRGLLKPILKNYSPIILILKRNWLNIMGEKFYEFCEPEKTYFNKNKKNDGILYIKCFNNVISFYIENNKSYILEKINAIFGYTIIKDIKLKQDPRILLKNKKVKNIDKNEEIEIKNKIDILENEELKKSLKEFGESLYRK